MKQGNKVRQGVLAVVLLAAIAVSAYSLFRPGGGLEQFRSSGAIGERAGRGNFVGEGAEQSRGFKEKTIQGSLMRRVLGPDGIPAVDEPTFVSADKARITDDAPVIGVALNGEAHAYSMYLLDAHEIVNDRFGDQPVATTW